MTDFEKNNPNRKKQELLFQDNMGNIIEVPWFPHKRLSKWELQEIGNLFDEIEKRIKNNNENSIEKPSLPL